MKQKQNKTKYSAILADIYALMSFVCFTEVILTPLWHYNSDTLNAAILVGIGWIAAIFSTKAYK